MKRIILSLVFSGLLAGMWASPAVAAKPVLIATFKSWDAFTQGEGSAKTCYMASVPRKALPTSVNHGAVYVTIAHKPRRKVRDEVNIVVGYDFKPKSNVKVLIGASGESLFTSGREAWAYDPAMDGRVVAAMKRGVSMEVRGSSTRGTKTTYEFSLYGFSAAYAAISNACKIG
jgi:hypothetical protein